MTRTEDVFGDTLLAVSGCLRGLFAAPEGYDFISSDYNSIEAIGLAMLAGEQWRIDVFNTHGKIYEVSGAKVMGVSFEEMMAYKRDTGNHHPARKPGKVYELACLGAETRVVTQRGLVPIVAVLPTDVVWDGESWVAQEGPIERGIRDTLNLDGVAITEDHLVSIGKHWVNAGYLAQSKDAFDLCSRWVAVPPGHPENYALPPVAVLAGRQTVYDLVNAGPLNRFTIATRTGFLIVHNCGYGGWINSAKVFGAPGTDEEIKAGIVAWRDASPSVVHFWGGQSVGRWSDKQPHLFGVEGAFIAAAQNPGAEYPVHRLDGTPSGVSYLSRGGKVYCKLPSGRPLTYHDVSLNQSTRPYCTPWDLSISFYGHNTNPKNGAMGWVQMDTYGPRLVENINQAVCRDILRNAILTLEAEGYPCVLHVYDEIVSQVPLGFGSVRDFEEKMMRRPAWAPDWPIRAAGGWRGRRYRKG